MKAGGVGIGFEARPGQLGGSCPRAAQKPGQLHREGATSFSVRFGGQLARNAIVPTRRIIAGLGFLAFALARGIA